MKYFELGQRTVEGAWVKNQEAARFFLDYEI
jgi:hypothetical protein